MNHQPPINTVAPLSLQLPEAAVEDIWCKNGQFWALIGGSDLEYRSLTERQVRTLINTHLAALGQTGIKSKEVSKAIVWICLKKAVDHVIPRLSGYQIGTEIINGALFLIPSALKVIQPVKGSADLIIDLLSHMLGSKQFPYFLSWLKVAYECHKCGSKRPGQVVAFCGPKECGKTLTQDLIITPILGGAAAEPYRYAIGRTEFNEDQFSAAHLKISDQKSPRNRGDIQDFIRRVAFNEDEQFHPKNRSASLLPIFRRMTISCNESEEDLAIIPPINDLEDKLMLFKCSSLIASIDRLERLCDDYLSKGGELPAHVIEFPSAPYSQSVPKERY